MKRSPTTAELMAAIKWSAAFGVLGLVAVALSLVIFVANAASERADICDVIEDVARGNAHALVVATDPGEAEAERRERYDQVVKDYLERVESNLGKCK